MRLYFWLLNGKCLAINMLNLFCKFWFWWNGRGWRKTCLITSAKFSLKSTSHTAFFVDHTTSWWFTTEFMWGQSLNKSCHPNHSNPAIQIKSIQSNSWLTPHMRWSKSSFGVHQHHHPQDHAHNWSAVKVLSCARELFSCLSHIKYLAISFCFSSHRPKQEQSIFPIQGWLSSGQTSTSWKGVNQNIEIRQRTTFTDFRNILLINVAWSNESSW